MRNEHRGRGPGAAPRSRPVINACIAAAIPSAAVGVETARGGFTPLGGAAAIMLIVAVAACVFLVMGRLMTAWRQGKPGPDRTVGGREPEWRPRAGGSASGSGTGGDRAPM
ncbi:hypothetical protein FNQ90_16515 [Streptomyces alkaliphilus]|uniref:Uncharacterized protein n=1 Tax=Streptomyces alkaliphilus TaxID=1472722 RepID=A0A7W3TF31_9ACTN|nr:hypothetical protein [Streptomyces alkaliphilus]MBB0245661.1 hypothetical protein [Streptomyces alkaliphilus]